MIVKLKAQFGSLLSIDLSRGRKEVVPPGIDINSPIYV